MREISSRTLTILVIVALAISVFSTFVNVQKLKSLDSITGRYATSDTGTVNLTIAATAYLNVTDNLVDFEQVDLSWTNWSEQYVDFFEVRNDGSVDINISIYATNNDSGIFSSTNMQ